MNLSIYDICNAVKKTMTIFDMRMREKQGGKTGSLKVK